MISAAVWAKQTQNFGVIRQLAKLSDLIRDQCVTRFDDFYKFLATNCRTRVAHIFWWFFGLFPIMPQSCKECRLLLGHAWGKLGIWSHCSWCKLKYNENPFRKRQTSIIIELVKLVTGKYLANFGTKDFYVRHFIESLLLKFNFFKWAKPVPFLFIFALFTWKLHHKFDYKL